MRNQPIRQTYAFPRDASRSVFSEKTALGQKVTLSGFTEAAEKGRSINRISRSHFLRD